MVASCPPAVPDFTGKSRCENASLVSPVSHYHQPVLVFRNIQCAECHGIPPDLTARWESRLNCRLLEEQFTVEDVIEAYRKKLCQVLRLPPSNDPNQEMDRGNAPRACSLPQERTHVVVMEPLSNFSTSGSPCSEDDQLLCKAYNLPISVGVNQSRSPVGFPSQAATYMDNPHCLKCLTGYEPKDFLDLSCSPSYTLAEASGRLFGIAVLFDLNQDESGVQVNGQLLTWQGFHCADDQVYSVADRMCRKIVCSAGFVLLHRECVRSDMVVEGDSQLVPVGSGYISIHMWLTELSGCRPNESFADRFFGQKNHNRGELEGVSVSQNNVQPHTSSYFFQAVQDNRLLSNWSCTDDGRQFNVLISTADRHDFHEVYENITNTLKTVAARELVTNISVTNVAWQDTYNSTRLCPDGRHPVVLNNAILEKRGQRTFVVYTKFGFKQFYSLNNVPFRVVLSQRKEDEDEEQDDREKPREPHADLEQTDNGEADAGSDQGIDMQQETSGMREVTGDSGGERRWTQDTIVQEDELHRFVRAIICERHVSNSSLTCPAHVYPLNQTLLENGTLIIEHDDGSEENFDEDEYDVQEDSVLVCSRFLSSSLVGSQYLFDFSVSQQYAIVASSVISELFLIFTIVVYSILPELRTLPGKIVLSLVVCLLIGQVTVYVDLPNKMACRVIAAVSHFIWLAAFIWMSALAVHMASTFVCLSAKQRTTDEARRVFRNYSLVCWSLPLVFVVTCFVLDVIPSVDVSMGYGRVACGWISEDKALIRAFFLPLAVCLTVNIFSFVAAVVGIERTTRASRLVSSRRSDGRRLLMYVKMSVALGFTWILGYVTAFVRSDWLLWLFIILNGLQGTFIALAYLANERVLHLLKKKLAKKSLPTKKICGTAFVKESTVQTKSLSVSSTYESGCPA